MTTQIKLMAQRPENVTVISETAMLHDYRTGEYLRRASALCSSST